MTDSTTGFARLSRVIAVPALAAALLVGGVQSTSAQSTGAQSGASVAQEENCEADRSNHLFGGLLTGPLTAISDLLPFTIAGEQYPVCDED